MKQFDIKHWRRLVVVRLVFISFREVGEQWQKRTGSSKVVVVFKERGAEEFVERSFLWRYAEFVFKTGHGRSHHQVGEITEFGRGN
jgi:hypothetical protein